MFRLNGVTLNDYTGQWALTYIYSYHKGPKFVLNTTNSYKLVGYCEHILDVSLSFFLNIFQPGLCPHITNKSLIAQSIKVSNIFMTLSRKHMIPSMINMQF